jgi:hypothetical protein
VRFVPLVILATATLSGCGGKSEQLAKCSADENPVPALGYAEQQKAAPPQQALARIVSNDCGPMRPVNS